MGQNILILLLFTVSGFQSDDISTFSRTLGQNTDGMDHYSEGEFEALSTLMLEIVTETVPSCDLILVNDEYFKSRMVNWVKGLQEPVYTLTLDGRGFWNSSRRDDGGVLVKPSGASGCTNVLVFCYSLPTCQTVHSGKLFRSLWDNGHLKEQRRSFLYIQNETVSTVRPPQLFQTNRTEGLPVLQSAVEILKELQSHVTLIRSFIPKGPSTLNISQQVQTFQLLTWTPNWLPGGSPLLSNVWSSDVGFRNPKRGLRLRMSDLRPGGLVRFCTSSKDLLPAIQIDSNDEFRGLDAQLIKIFASHFQLQTTFSTPQDNEVGEEMEDKSWTGVIGELLDQNADIGIGQIVFKHEFLHVELQFSPGFVVVAGVVVCPLPGYLPTLFRILEPFEPTTWLAVAISFAGVLALINILQYLNPKVFSGRRKWGEGWFSKPSKLKTRQLSWIYIIAPIFRSSIPSKVIPGRNAFLCLLGFWICYSFIISTGYSTVLIGALSFPPQEKNIDDLHDLSDSRKSWVISHVVEEILETDGNSNSESDNFLLSKAIQSGNRGTNSDLSDYEFVKTSGNCLIAEKGRAEFVIRKYYMRRVNNRMEPLMRISQDSFLLGPAGWILRADTDFILKSYFNDLFLNMAAHGILIKLSEAYVPPYYEGIQDEGPKSLGMDSIQVIFTFLGIGLSISSLTLITELIYYNVLNIRHSWQRERQKPPFQYLP